MGFLAAAIPVAMSVLGAMSKESEGQAPAPVLPPPPTLGEVMAQNDANYSGKNFIQPSNPFSQFQFPPVGGKGGM